MSNEPVYLDYNATAPVRPEICTLIQDILSKPGNASSVHGFGRAARKYVEDAREQVARLVNADTSQVVFNSGATEGNNTVLNAYKDKRVLVSAIEHPAVMQPAPHAEKIPVTPNGVVDLEALANLLKDGEKPALISVMLVNSETGVIQPVREIATIAKDKGVPVHTDAVQAAGRIPLDFHDLGVQYITLSAHKMAGPQGAGALIACEGTNCPKFMQGGGQENMRRAGTHNTSGIAGMGLAAEIAMNSIDHYAEIEKLRDHLEAEIRKISNEAIIYGENAPRVGNTSNIGLPGVPAQTQMMALDLAGIAVSSGSACSSGSWKPSHVLQAMGVDEDSAKSALRISLGWGTKSADIDRFLNVWSDIVKRAKT